MDNQNASQVEILVSATEAAKMLGVRKHFLYRLSKTTPGIFVLGHAIRFDVAALRSWARNAAESRGGAAQVGDQGPRRAVKSTSGRPTKAGPRGVRAC